MVIRKNKRGGFLIDGEDNLTLTKNRYGLILGDTDGGVETEAGVRVGANFYNSDIENFNYLLNVSKHKLKTLIAVIKFLYK